MAIAVVRNGKIEQLKSYGFANLEHRVSVKPETIFQSGSIGKQFTAAAVMLLVQNGKISLDDKITKFFPDPPETWSNITVRHLLTHTAGFGDYPEEVDLRRDYSEDQMMDFFKKVPPSFAPGERWNYSNVGYVMLGILIRKVTGKFYGDFLKERIFSPAGMTTARIISEADIVPNRAAGYRVLNGEIKNHEWVSPSTNTTADGSLYLSILDLAKWDAALYRDEPLKQSTLARIWEPVKLNNGVVKNYGFGWFTGSFHNHRVVFHGGTWQGFKSFIMRFLDDRLTIILLANSSNTLEFKLARGLAAAFYPEFTVPTTRAVAGDDLQTVALMRRLLFQLAHGSVDKDLVTPSVSTELTPARITELATIINSLTLPVAIVHSEELVERRDENDLRLYRYVFNDIGKTLSLTIKVNTEEKIAAFDLVEVKGSNSALRED
jgi:CubicO group peptidase (beta-lactamase class C family)